MGVSKIAVETWLEEMKFSRWAVNNCTGEVQYMDDNGVNLWVNWETGNFRFGWLIPCSLFKIVSGDLSPVWRLDHLEKTYARFLREVKGHGSNK